MRQQAEVASRNGSRKLGRTNFEANCSRKEVRLQVYHLPSARCADDNIHRAVVGHPHTCLMLMVRYNQMARRAHAMDEAKARP